MQGGFTRRLEVLSRAPVAGQDVARAVVKDEGEVEEMQLAYVNAFTHLHQFEELLLFSTRLTRVALNEAFARRRRMRQSVGVDHGGVETRSLESSWKVSDQRNRIPMLGVCTSASPGARRGCRCAARHLSHGVHVARYRRSEHHRNGRGAGTARRSGQDPSTPCAGDDSASGDRPDRRSGRRQLSLPRSSMRPRRLSSACQDCALFSAERRWLVRRWRPGHLQVALKTDALANVAICGYNNW